MDRVDVAALAATAERLQAVIGEDLRQQLPAAQPLRALNVLQLGEHQFPERVQLLGPLIHAGDLAMVFAGRGVGKTQVLLSIGAALAFGAVFLRWKAAQPVGVLYLDAEMAGAVMQQRVASFIPADAGEDMAANFRLFTPDLLPEGQPLPDLSTVAGQQMVEPLIDDTTRVIVIDNLSAWCRTGKENESESWTPVSNWLLTLRRRGIAVLLVHHAGKNGEQRGNSKKEDLLDIVIQLKRAGDYDPKTGAAFTWAVTKGRHLHGDDAAELDLVLTITDVLLRVASLHCLGSASRNSLPSCCALHSQGKCNAQQTTRRWHRPPPLRRGTQQTTQQPRNRRNTPSAKPSMSGPPSWSSTVAYLALTPRWPRRPA